MIKIRNYREQVYPVCVDYGLTAEYQTSAEAAFASLLKYELLYGAGVRELSPTLVVVETTVASKLDTVKFSGSEEEMAPLVALCAEWAKDQNEPLPEECVERLLENTKGNAFAIKHLLPFVEGRTRLKNIVKRLEQGHVTMV